MCAVGANASSCPVYAAAFWHASIKREAWCRAREIGANLPLAGLIDRSARPPNRSGRSAVERT